MTLRRIHLWQLAILALFALSPLPGRAQDSCPPEGCATSACGQALNRLKNRTNAPAAQDIDTSVTVQAMIAPGDDQNRFDSSRGATVEGYVVKVYHGGCAESCNCNKGAVRDTHIEIAPRLADQSNFNRHVIVEVTPRVREMMRQQGVDWSTETLHDPTRGILGKKVRVTGWLLFDSMHERESTNTKRRAHSLCGTLHNSVWRKTAWEVHPITSMEVIESPHLPASFVIEPLDNTPCHDKPCGGGGGGRHGRGGRHHQRRHHTRRHGR